MIPGIVLTAGLGTRLDPLTRLVAKPAVPVGRRPLVEHVLKWLRGQDITDLVLNLHHLPETITGLLGDGAHLGQRIRYSWEPTILGSAGGPKRALSLLSAGRALVVNGDTLCRVEVRPMLEAHERSGALVTMAVMPNPAPDRYNGIVLGDEAQVTAIVPRGEAADRTWHFVGVQIVEAAAFAHLDDGVASETTSGVYQHLIADRPGSVRGWPVNVPFMDVGTPRDYLRVALEHATAPGPASRHTGCAIWPEAHVPEDADLEACVVAGDVVLPPGFKASQSVLVPASVLRPGEQVPVIGQVAVFPL